MSALSSATKRTPFANGTEAAEWQDKWCAYCTRDHGMHDGSLSSTCDIWMDCLLGATSPEGWRWPESWLPEPPGPPSIPSRLICGSFQPCHKGSCSGDPGAEARAERVTLVRQAWKDAR